MSQNPLSLDFLKNLVKRTELRESGHKPIFTNDELTLIKETVEDKGKKFEMRGKTFVVRYFKFKNEDWVTVRPIRGFVPMFSSPTDDLLKAEIL